MKGRSSIAAENGKIEICSPLFHSRLRSNYDLLNIRNMKKILVGLGFLCFALSCKTSMQLPSSFAQEHTFQLAKPIIKVDSVFFQKSATVSIELEHPEVEIFFVAKHLSTDGFLGKATAPIEIKDRKTITADAHHPNFLKSESASIEVIKINSIARKAKISMTPKPKAPYIGNGAATLTDFKKGSFQFRDGNWLGFASDTVQFDLKFPKKQSLTSIGISFLKDHDSWIFLPKKIEILNSGKIISESVFPTPESEVEPDFKFVNISFLEKKTDSISIRIINLEGIPNWHPGKGLPSWLFIDEVFFPN